ncbi:MAG TPA: glycosyltransferase [Pyrinomonadaceae bacterium]|jgi:cellulose synthase/poly-beta-1,6-N-acetylglucosamine synthase-like glycosyltransferase|nr:glycosyltransferase [Pyrinomonadaceae bacterium]
MFFFYLFAALTVCLGVDSLRAGFRYLSFVRREMAKVWPVFEPFVSVIAPVRGLDPGLRDNLAALFRQDYPSYELIFVTDSAEDPALAVIEEARAASASRSVARARVVLAGAATESGQKVHNLRRAVGEIDPSSAVLAFVDSDARASERWLRSLVAPLAQKGAGAATGYRWFIPVKGGFTSHLRSVWNASIASALGESAEKNFCWGGSTAIRRETFESLNMLEQWRGALSDDFALMRALRRANLPIHFVPQCLTPSLEDCNFTELVEFTTRQLKITRVYAPHFWKAVLLGSFLFVTIFFGGLALVVTRAALGLGFLAPLLFVTLIFALGAAKAYVRWLAVKLPLAAYAGELRRGLWAHLLLWPIASALYLYNALAAAVSRRINWRGITYELKSPTETVIIDDVRPVETITTT